MNNFPVERKKTPLQYLLAFLVLVILGIVFLVILISVPYLLFQLLVIVFNTLKFGITFIVIFWLIVVLILWAVKLIEILDRGYW
ncbi:MAG: hypothetical protein GXO45_01710 [Aquificae bacterium]|nr:hypothetical protein [Aquificota bacterium]